MAILERTPVQATENMTDIQFANHMTKRHRESLGYLKSFRGTIHNPMLMRCWRAFHGHLHRWRVDLEHEHGEP